MAPSLCLATCEMGLLVRSQPLPVCGEPSSLTKAVCAQAFAALHHPGTQQGISAAPRPAPIPTHCWKMAEAGRAFPKQCPNSGALCARFLHDEDASASLQGGCGC